MVKDTRARRLSSTGGHPLTYAANLQQVPGSLHDALTGRQLAELVDLLRLQYLRGMAEGEAVACDQGYVWDARRQAMRDVAA